MTKACQIDEAQRQFQFFARWHDLDPSEQLELARQFQRERDCALADRDRLALHQRQPPAPIAVPSLESLG